MLFLYIVFSQCVGVFLNIHMHTNLCMELDIFTCMLSCIGIVSKSLDERCSRAKAHNGVSTKLISFLLLVLAVRCWFL